MPYKTLKNAIHINKAVIEWQIDHIIYMDSSCRALAMNAAPRVTSTVYVHGSEVVPRSFLNEITSNRTRMQLSALMKTNCVVANSKYTASLVKKLNQQLSPTIIYPCFDKRRIFNPNYHLQNPFEYFKKDFIFLTVSRLVRRKGHENVLKLLLKIKNKLPKFKYVIVGEGPEEKRLKKICAQFGLHENVIFWGTVKDDDLGAYYHFADLFIMLPQKVNHSVEGFGLSYIEASASKTVTIASNHGGAKEAVQNKKTGFVFDLNNLEHSAQIILELTQNKEQLKHLESNGQRWAKLNFNPEKTSLEFEKILQKTYA